MIDFSLVLGVREACVVVVLEENAALIESASWLPIIQSRAFSKLQAFCQPIIGIWTCKSI